MRILLLVVVLLCGCSKLETSSSNQYSFNQIELLEINWSEILSGPEISYFVFIYKIDCPYSQSVENQIVRFALTNVEKIYFIEGSNGIPLGSQVYKTIGLDKVEDLYILGFPTLVLICKATLALNLTGAAKIDSFVRTYD